MLLNVPFMPVLVPECHGRQSRRPSGDGLVRTPMRVFNNDEREYSEMNTGTWWWDQQVCYFLRRIISLPLLTACSSCSPSVLPLLMRRFAMLRFLQAHKNSAPEGCQGAKKSVCCETFSSLLQHSALQHPVGTAPSITATNKKPKYFPSSQEAAFLCCVQQFVFTFPAINRHC